MDVQHGHDYGRENGGGDGSWRQVLGGSRDDGGLWRLFRSRGGRRGGIRGRRGEMAVSESSSASLLDRCDPFLYDHHVLRLLSLQHAEGDGDALADAASSWRPQDEFLVLRTLNGRTLAEPTRDLPAVSAAIIPGVKKVLMRCSVLFRQ
jgi:hypothetical protein